MLASLICTGPASDLKKLLTTLFATMGFFLNAKICSTNEGTQNPVEIL